MSYAFRKAGHSLLLLAFPIFFGFTYWFLSKVPEVLNAVNTVSSVIISIVYMYDSTLRGNHLASSTRQVFASLAITTLIASLLSLFLTAHWVNVVNIAAMTLITYLCVRAR